MKKKGLGKGVKALLGSEIVAGHQNDTMSGNTRFIDILQLTPNPFQPRQVFDDEAITTLTESIRQHGIIQPLAVRPITRDGQSLFEIIAGERRFRAAKQAGLRKVPVVIHEIDDHDSAAFALIENLQREDLNVIEKAKGMLRLITDFDLTHDACGKLLGQSRSSVSNHLRLLELSHVVQDAIADKSIDMGHARALLAVDQAEQHELLQKIRLNGLSVRETEALVRGAQSTDHKPSRQRKSDFLKISENQLSKHLQTKVGISQQKDGRGKITLAFEDEATLQSLLARLGILNKDSSKR